MGTSGGPSFQQQRDDIVPYKRGPPQDYLDAIADKKKIEEVNWNSFSNSNHNIQTLYKYLWLVFCRQKKWILRQISMVTGQWRMPNPAYISTYKKTSCTLTISTAWLALTTTGLYCRVTGSDLGLCSCVTFIKQVFELKLKLMKTGLAIWQKMGLLTPINIFQKARPGKKRMRTRSNIQRKCWSIIANV